MVKWNLSFWYFIACYRNHLFNLTAWDRAEKDIYDDFELKKLKKIKKTFGLHGVYKKITAL